MKDLSLKQRLIISFCVVAIGIWGGSAALSWYESREYVNEFYDTYQLHLARQLSTADWSNIKPGTQDRVNDLIEELEDDGEDEDEALGLAVFDKNGEMIFNDDEDGKYFVFNPKASGFVNQPNGHKGKMWRIIWMKSVDGDYTIAVGQELKYRNKAATEMVEEAVGPWIIGLAILLLAIIFLVTKELRPLKRITKNLSSRGADDFSPLSDKEIPQEIKPLISSMNELFDKIDKMLVRERSFISDAAHELRSPLTAMKVQLEVAELAGDDKETHEKALANLTQGLERVSRLVEQLLALSRLESNAIRYKEFAPLDWASIMDNVNKEQKQLAEEKKISLTSEISEPYFINEGQSFLWSLLLRNLIDNAIKYSKEGADIRIILNSEKLSVSNNKITLNSKNIARLGERFFRPAGQNINGSGLGLSIVKKIARLHNCEMQITVQDDIFTVTINRVE